MYKVIVSQKFKHSYKKFVRKYSYLQTNIDKAVIELAENPFSPSLSTHKLSGELFELFACKCGYNCRIVFSIEKIKVETEKTIVLVDIGTHRDVY
jgi:mRNA interferase YafQ